MGCRICGKTGCNAKRHWTKCSYCNERGHNSTWHTPAAKRRRTELSTSVDNDLKKLEQLKPTPSYSQCEDRSESLFTSHRQRQSRVALSQGELDMATRVLLACQEEKKEGPNDLGRPVERTAWMTGLGTNTIQHIKNSISVDTWPKVKEDTRGDWSRLQEYGEFDHNQLVTKIHNHIEKMHKYGCFPTLTNIREKLNFHDGIRISSRFLSKILHEVGYSYKEPSANNVFFVQETQALRDQRLTYLQLVAEKRATKKVVYVDESYVNKSHNAHRCWVRKGSQIYVPSGKGPRYILIGAGSRDGWLFHRAFKNNSSSSDYHSAMNGDHFEEIFQEMCVEATDKLGPAVFVMDNAAYHKRLEDERLRLGYWSKLPAAEVKAAWAEGTIPGQEESHGHLKTKKDILNHLRTNMPRGRLQIEKLAAAEGHEVLFLPPYRPELNAIETAWGVTKNFVARNNLPSISFKDLEEVIQRGFAEATVPVWNALDSKVVATEQHQLKLLLEEKERLEKFRQEHPDLMFHVGSESDSESDGDCDLDSDCGSEAGEEAVLSHLRNDVEGIVNPPAPQHSTLEVEVNPPSQQYNSLEMEVAMTLATSFFDAHSGTEE